MKTVLTEDDFNRRPQLESLVFNRTTALRQTELRPAHSVRLAQLVARGFEGVSQLYTYMRPDLPVDTEGNA